MKPYVHAQNSVKQFGGIWEDYIDLHNFMDSSKGAICNSKHRALTHNSWFISVVIPRVFGEVFKRDSDGVYVSSRDIAEQHVSEDYGGFIPSAQDFLDNMECQEWMNNGNGEPPKSTGKTTGRKPDIIATPVDGSRSRIPKEPLPEIKPFNPLDDFPPVPWPETEGPIWRDGYPGVKPILID